MAMPGRLLPCKRRSLDVKDPDVTLGLFDIAWPPDFQKEKHGGQCEAM